MGKRSAHKGSSFERDICKQLSIWWMDDTQQDDVFWRTSGSGGRATNRMKKGKQTASAYGDLAATDDRGKPLMDMFCFELKRGYQWDLAQLLEPDKFDKTVIGKFWAQAIDSAKDAKAKHPALIVKLDRRPALILVPRPFIVEYVRESVRNTRPFFYMYRDGGLISDAIAVMQWNVFLQYIKPQKIKLLLEKHW